MRNVSVLFAIFILTFCITIPFCQDKKTPKEYGVSKNTCLQAEHRIKYGTITMIEVSPMLAIDLMIIGAGLDSPISITEITDINPHSQRIYLVEEYSPEHILSKKHFFM